MYPVLGWQKLQSMVHLTWSLVEEKIGVNWMFFFVKWYCICYPFPGCLNLMSSHEDSNVLRGKMRCCSSALRSSFSNRCRSHRPKGHSGSTMANRKERHPEPWGHSKGWEKVLSKVITQSLEEKSLVSSLNYDHVGNTKCCKPDLKKCKWNTASPSWIPG